MFDRLRFWRAEHRQSGADYDAVIVAALEAAASESSASASATAAVRAVVGVWARAFAAAIVTPESGRTRGLGAAWRYGLGRRLLLGGRAVYALEVSGGRLLLLPCRAVEVLGTRPDPATWRYRLTVETPDGDRPRTLPAAAVVDIVLDGGSPLAGSVTARALAEAEAALADEAATARGFVLPVPRDGQDSNIEGLRADVRTLKGRHMLVETTAAGWGETARAPLADWKPQRLGASPPDALVTLRRDLADAVYAAAGVSPALLGPSSDGTAQREAWRRLVSGTIQPVANVAIAELALKLEVPDLGLDFKPLASSDLAGRGRVVGQLTQAGVPVAEALAIAGLD